MRTFGPLFRNLSWLLLSGLSLCRTTFVVLSMMLGFISTANAAAVSGQGTWETTLQGRDLDGNLATAEAYYDTDLNITWLANANLADTESFGMASSIGVNGNMTWDSANNWIQFMNSAGYLYLGLNHWRMPTTIDADGPDADTLGNDGCSFTNLYQGIDCGFNITTLSEMSHMFYVTLGENARYTTSGVAQYASLDNTGPFSKLQPLRYWSGTQYATVTSYAWYFDFRDGDQIAIAKTNNYFVWAVHSGDVGVAVATSTVPVPAAVWLFGSGLLGLVGIARSRSAK